MPGTGQQVGRFPVELIAQVDEEIERAGGLESRIEWIVNACRARLAGGDAEAFAALRAAVEAHRRRWQDVNGKNPNEARPADLRLWAALGEEAQDDG